MPIDSFSTPASPRKLRQQCEMRAGVFLRRRNAHQPFDREPVGLAAALHEGHRLARLDAGLLRLRAGVDLHVKFRRLALFGDFLRQLAQRSSRGRPSRSTSNSATASFALFDCSGPIRCSSMSGNSAFRSGHLPCASCTRFSPNTRCPASITGLIASASKVFDTATSVTEPAGRFASRSAAAILPRTIPSCSTAPLMPLSAPFQAFPDARGVDALGNTW